ncbi:2,6-dihydropseudooxynicotine hydrolase [Moelleriella libera RCEF 2490]|uniref:2,6-dihydropseudooxynicotine hydrolase n=1 Tax=Moelleriella libera RCEF 2490 TaxID=1081109 RepID=A0A168EIJ1_9HYPO|nr:2,6-dihydropseudooxynicotine hydrolase [Moelleriella libera RCEF 2490]
MADPNATMFQLNRDAKFHFEILRGLSLAAYDGADVGECLVAAKSILPGDLESFASSFAQVASSVLSRALSVANDKLRVYARTAFFSAATYFRAADFFLHGNPADARIMTYWAAQTDAFDQGLALLSPPGQRFTVRTPNFDVPCIWLTPNYEVRQRPTIIMGNGFDGSQEEMLHVAGLAALERGYNVLTYEGPGQPSVRRYQNKGFIAEWEQVVTPVLDHVLSNRSDQVDPDAVALYGLSLGGYLAARTAAFEHRFAAIVLMDGVWDFGAVVRRAFEPRALKLHDAGDKTAFDELARRYLRPGVPAGLRWALEQGLWAFDTTSPFDFVSRASEFTLERVARRIKTPVLIGSAEDDAAFEGQAQQLARALGKYGRLHEFTNEQLAGTHSGFGALKQQNQVVFDWLARVFDGQGGGRCE